MLGPSKFDDPRPSGAGELYTFRAEIHGTWNGFIVTMRDRSFVVQLSGDGVDDFEDVLNALRDAFEAHRSHKQ